MRQVETEVVLAAAAAFQNVRLAAICRTMIKPVRILLAVVLMLARPAIADVVRPLQPALPDNFVGIPLDGGRTQAISVDPTGRQRIVIATQWGGFWRTVNGGARWAHLDGLHAVFAVDVAHAADGNTLIATQARDNGVVNGGGIYVSHDGGTSWTRPASAEPPLSARSPARKSGYGISWAPGSSRRAYVGTDFGVATTDDGGETWSHVAVETTSAPAGDLMQSSVLSILALPSNVVLATTRTGIYRSDDGGRGWRRIRSGDFSANFKLLDVSPVDADKVFAMQSYSTLFLYEVATNAWTQLALPGGGSRSPFVRVARNLDTGNAIDIWVGLGVNLGRATCANITCVKGLTSTSWTTLWRPQGVHDDSGHMGLDANGRPVLYGSDGGVFKPTDGTGNTWTRASVTGSGLDSYQITSLAGTNVDGPTPHTSLYFATQDNGLWSSPDGGQSWPASDCAEGFRMEAPPHSATNTGITVAYGKVGCGPSGNMFSDADFANQRAIPDVDTANNPVTNMGQAVLISPRNWIRWRTPPSANPELWVSNDDGLHWRRRATVSLQPAGMPRVASVPRLRPSTPTVLIPFFGARTLPNGDPRIGLIRLVNPLALGEVTLGDADLLYLPDGGSLGVRATEFDWQAVWAVQPTNPRYIIAPDIANNCVRITHDGGITFPCDANLTDLVLRGGALKMYDGDAWHLAVTHIKFHPSYPEQVFVGTRDAGVVWGRGNSWRIIDGSEAISYLTGFFPRADGVIYASSYGQGLWELDTRLHIRPFRPEVYCKMPCIFPGPDPTWLEHPDWKEWFRDKEVLIALGGRILGLKGKGKEMLVTVSAGTRIQRFVPGTVQPMNLLIEEGAKGVVPAKLGGKGPLTGVVFAKGEQLAAVVRGDLTETTGGAVPAGGGNKAPAPYLMLSSDAPGGALVLRKKDTLHIVAHNFEPGRGVHVEVDGVTIQKADADKAGDLHVKLERPDTLKAGQHRVRVVQKLDDRELSASATFATTDAEDNFERKKQ
jgi:photosystem II stability/assembly factor-like uncharacterized protein